MTTRTPKARPVEAWAWAVVADRMDPKIFFTPEDAQDEQLNLVDKRFSGVEVVPLFPRTPADAQAARDDAAVLRAVEKWHAALANPVLSRTSLNELGDDIFDAQTRRAKRAGRRK